MSAGKLLPRHHEQFRSKDYWNDFFKQRTEAFEWYGDYADLRRLVHKTLRREDRILVVGCGNSNFSADLYDDGFEEVENVDFSQPVVAEMWRLHAKQRPKMTWRVMDVTDMSGYEDGAFDAVIDKGTLDALMSEDTPEVRRTGAAMLTEIGRVLSPGGRYMCVTLWQDYIGSTLLSHLFFPRDAAPADEPPASWSLDLHCAAASSKPSPYLPMCLVATKRCSVGPEAPAGVSRSGARMAAWFDVAGKPLPPGSEPSFLAGERQVLDHVRGGQQVHRRRHDLREIRPGRFEQEDLWGREGGVEGQKSARFTLLITDVASPSPSASPCAVVLIPRGRDRDFTFSSPEGLAQVAESANARRLIAVRLNRGHTFEGGVEGVKAEVSPFIPDLAPALSGVDPGGPGIPIMAVSDGLGSEGTIVAEGCLELSGNYVVEEEEEDEDDVGEDESGRPAGVYRRLIFLENEGIVQTEVRLLGEDEGDGTRSGGPGSATRARKASSKSKGSSKKGGKGKGKGGKEKRSSSSAASGNGTVPGGGSSIGARVDSSYLCFELHRCMVAGVALADLHVAPGLGNGVSGDGRAPTALVIGLGGGALPMALRRVYPGVSVLAVELDAGIVGVARDHFGLEESDKLKVVVDDGIAFVNGLVREAAITTAAAAAAAAEDAPQENVSPSSHDARPGNGASLADDESQEGTRLGASGSGSGSPSSTAGADQVGVAGLSSSRANSPNGAPSCPDPPDTGAGDARAPDPGGAGSAAKRLQPEGAGLGWGDAFGPPYSAIFVDVDSKDRSVGMSCPPAAFLDVGFLKNLRALLRGASATGAGGHGQARGPGVLAINVAARSGELLSGAVGAVSEVFAGGELFRLRAGEDAVNSVLLGLPRPRARSRSGPLTAVVEQVLEAAPISKRSAAGIMAACERAERIEVAAIDNKPRRVALGTAKQQQQQHQGGKRGARKRGAR